MRNLICNLLLVLASHTLGAQSLTPEVVATTGETFSNSTVTLEWTLGEIMTETFSERITMTQGFHQPPEGVPPVGTTALSADNPIVLYPNPATKRVNVRLPVGAELLNLLGVTGRNISIRFNGQRGELTANLAGLPAGLYFLLTRLADGRIATNRLVIH
ncbi:T9SS type A sorting domain-containing protein [Neolewinella persica]|uniref:T9SS type A sorting domain-containing protein n=1 Tax=Neolewinella persica TaxID=70998 RepID=UPI0003771E30|nr:T9SS type A sorting domain-containing protein [Neolewinella persica]